MNLSVMRIALRVLHHAHYLTHNKNYTIIRLREVVFLTKKGMVKLAVFFAWI
jgi:hypothetical protein